MLRPSHLANIFTAAATTAVLLVASPAHAEVSSWFSVSGGGSVLTQASHDAFAMPTLQLDLGMGSSPAYAFVVGGLVRSSTIFGEGTDWSALARVATQGFATGGYGIALDGGAYRRMWGGSSDYGPTTSIELGAPWGLQLSATASFGVNGERTYTALFGVDLLRLTVYRLSGKSWWPNPRPAWQPARSVNSVAQHF